MFSLSRRNLFLLTIWLLILLVASLYLVRNFYAVVERVFFPVIPNVAQQTYYFDVESMTYTFYPLVFKQRKNCYLFQLRVLNNTSFSREPKVLPWEIYSVEPPHELLADHLTQDFRKLPHWNTPRPALSDVVMRIHPDAESLELGGFYIMMNYRCPWSWLTGDSISEVGPLPIRTYLQSDIERLRVIEDLPSPVIP